MIEIDIDKHTIHLEVSDEELAEQLGHIKRPRILRPACSAPTAKRSTA